MSLWFGLRARCMCGAGRAERLTRDVVINVVLVRVNFRNVFDHIRGRGLSENDLQSPNASGCYATVRVTLPGLRVTTMTPAKTISEATIAWRLTVSPRINGATANAINGCK